MDKLLITVLSSCNNIMSTMYNVWNRSAKMAKNIVYSSHASEVL